MTEIPSQRRPGSPADRGAVDTAGREIFSFAQIQHLVRVEFGRAQRYGYPLVVLELAVDRLGHLRDVFGYDLKEHVLGQVCDLLKRETRASDLLGRMPDDRLLVLVPHSPPQKVEVLARRLLAAAHRLSFDHEGRRVEITLSIGGSHSVAGETLFFDALLETGRAALSDAVAAGGDRYVLRAAGDL